ncbi:serine/threonine-protein kinase RIPK-like [Impatiens glandulifera]|uniref:serine/threonine-protein kinase RIPK-like n=1 Tax=Impatiens glandulifera TaxID=253017 RepID=UPI001FB0AB08|nr:serine/threonine-protein kinase RIPK-like [Impatiens glandulifera]
MCSIDLNRSNEKQDLVEWALPYLGSERNIKSILDFQIEGQYSFQGVMKAGTIIQRCLQKKSKERPSMKEVVVALEEIATIEGKTMYELHTTSSSTSESSPDVVIGRSIHVDTKPTNAAKPKLSPFFSRLVFKSKSNLN